MTSSFLKNTLTNYLSVGVRVLQGIFITRWTIHYLGLDYYGLWALLWSFFSYAILLDFGFGVSAQKYTSMEIFRKDIGKYNKIISTVFSFHLAMLIIIVLGTIAASFFLEDIINVTDPDKLEYCRTVFLTFGIGTAFIFPLGMFSEILVGMQKIYLRNYINITSKIVELVGTLTIFLCGGRLLALTIFVLVLTLCTNTIMAYFTSQLIKGFKITWKLDWATCKEISAFSGFVYLISISRLILNRSNRLLISIFCGLPSVGEYHLASRLSDFCYMGASQYQENIRPVSANLHALGQTEKLSAIIFNSLRWNVFVSILIMLPSFIFAGDITEFLFGITNVQIVYMAQLFVASVYISCVCRSIPDGYLQMTEKHKLIGYVTMVEAVANVAANIFTLPRYGVESVLWNSIIIRLILTFTAVLPTMLNSLKIEWCQFLRKIYIVPTIVCIPAALVGWSIKYFGSQMGLFPTLALGGGLTVATFVATAYFFMLSAQERIFVREKIVSKIKKYIRK